MSLRFVHYFLVIFVVCGSLGARAFPEIPREDQILVHYGNASEPEIRADHDLKLTIWNVQKFTHGEAYRDLFHLAVTSDLVLLQESMMGDTYKRYFEGFSGLAWTNAISFFDGSSGTGVSTASRIAPTFESYVQSEAREPIMSTPKMIVITKYKITGIDDELMVVNIHGINFVPTWIYASQIAQLEKAAINHKGPLIVAGDFNTHLPDRYLVLKQMVDDLGLNYIPMENQRDSLFIFDHAFVRGLKFASARVRYDVVSSDHYPLEFKIPAH